MTFISFASSASFSASNTSPVLGHLLQWLFPNASEQTLLFLHFVVRKLAHFVEYAILGLLAARALRNSPNFGVRDRWFLISAALVIAYALVDEYHQSFVPSRTGSISDSFVDMAGGLSALLVCRRLLRKESASKMTKPQYLR